MAVLDQRLVGLTGWYASCHFSRIDSSLKMSTLGKDCSPTSIEMA